MEPIRFSIVVPTYNRAALIKHTLQVALKQEYNNYEIIVIDDAGTDNTADVIAAMNSPKIRYIRQPVNKERSAARNLGTQLATGTYVYFLDSDDRIYPKHLKVAASYIAAHHHPEFIVPTHEVLDQFKGETITRNQFSMDLNKELIKGNVIGCMFYLRRDIALQYPFNEDRLLSSGSEDFELCLRLAARFKIHVIREVTCAFVNHEHRSVLQINMATLLGRINHLEYYLELDPVFMKVYGMQWNAFRSDNKSYIALHLAMIKGHKIPALKALLESFWLAPKRLLSTRRCYSIIMKLLLR